MKWKRIALALGIAGIVGGATAALAAANGHRGRNFQTMITARVNHLLDEVDLNAAADQRAQDMAATAKEIIIPALVKVHDTLTPAQRQKLAAIVKSNHQHQGGFGGPQE